MGWFSNLFKKNNINQQYAETMSGFSPLFSQFGTNIYASDVVQQAINCIVSEMKKLRPEHIRENGNDIITVNSSLQTVLNSPNPLMTTSELDDIMISLAKDNYIDFVASNSKNGYYYCVTLKSKAQTLKKDLKKQKKEFWMLLVRTLGLAVLSFAVGVLLKTIFKG